MAYTQEERLISIATPLGADALLLQGFTGQDAISQLFTFQLDLLSESTVDAQKILGQQVTVTVRLADGGKRYFNGYINRFAAVGAEARFTHYRAEMVPWLWFLTRTADCRIFQNLAVPDIISKIFKDLDFADFKLSLTGSFAPREYCVQYRETDFNFVSRLMEQYGIFYFFEHTADKHTLILANAGTAHRPCPNQPKARYEAVANTVEAEDAVTGWQVEQTYGVGSYTLRDYNFETPTTSLEATVETTVNLKADKKFEIYDYPGEYLKKGEGTTLVKLRIEEEEVPHRVVGGSGTCRAFTSGFRFDLYGYAGHDGSYVLTDVRHTASVGDSYASRTETRAQETYCNEFSCIPAKVPFRAPRATPKPTVLGAQTAVVVGKAGEEIWTDKYGRVKVQFHWDREGKYDENSSCWIRVAQSWAGKRWGAFFLPRIGQEVIVDFLEGDPDQPIVVGSVYNAEQMPPYTLPGEQTKSTIKSYSSKGGGGFNEIRFEDKKGKEQLFINAEHNQDVRVKKDSFEWVGQDRHLIVVGDQFELVKGDKHLHVKGDQNEKIGGTLSFEAGMDIQEKVGMKHATNAGLEIHGKAGMTLVVEAGMSLTFKVGPNFIMLSPAGIVIQAGLLMLNSAGVPGVGSGVMAQAPTDAKEADKAEAGAAGQLPTVTPPKPLGPPSPQAVALRHAAKVGLPFCEKCAAAAYAAAIARGATPEEAAAEAAAAGRAGAAADAGEYWKAPGAEKTFVGIELLHEQGHPLAGVRYRIIPPDGRPREGTLDEKGCARVDGLDPGACEIAFFPDLDGDWAAAPAPPAEPTAQGAEAAPPAEPSPATAVPAGGEPAPAGEKTFVAIELVDDQGKPKAGMRYRITPADGTPREGKLDDNGCARVDDLDPGTTCEVTFPDLDGSDWSEA